MHASSPAIHRLVLPQISLEIWNIGSCLLRQWLRVGESYSFRSLPCMCHVLIWACFCRIFDRGVWWYCYWVIKTIARWFGVRSHCARQLPWDLGARSDSTGLRVASMQSDGSDTVWWMLSRNVSTDVTLLAVVMLRWLCWILNFVCGYVGHTNTKMVVKYLCFFSSGIYPCRLIPHVVL